MVTVAKTCAFMHPTPVFEWVTCGNEIARNYPKHEFCMHPDTRFRNGLRAATKLRETTPNMSFGPKVVDWAFSLRKRRNGSDSKNSCFCAPDTRYRNG